MAVLSRSALEASPLADLHLIAAEIGIDGFRRLRKNDLVDTILARQSAEDGGAATAEAEAAGEAERERPRRGRRGGRGRSRAARRDEDDDAAERAEDAVAEGAEADGDEESARTARRGRRRAADADEAEERPRRSRRRGAAATADEDVEDRATRRGREADEDEQDRPRRGGRGGARADAEGAAEEREAEGVVELLGNGSGFLRVSPPDPSDDDVYISAAQIRRCELVSGDRVNGPVRPPRRAERYPSLVRIDTINGRAADEVAEGTPFDDLPAEYPNQRIALGSDDPTLKAIEWLTPLGRGSRATISGAPHAGKSEALRRLAGVLAEHDELDIQIVLAGVRPEEVAEWKAAGAEPTVTLTFAASADAQGQAIERAIETAKRIAARGGNAVVLIDTLAYLHPQTARRAIASARNIVDGGSLTIVATSEQPLGGETTLIALDAALTSTGRFPALDLVASGTLHPERLVGEAGADAIAQARAAALG